MHIATQRATEIANDCQELRLADYAKLKGPGIAAAGAAGAAPAVGFGVAAAGAGGGFGAAKPAFGAAGGGFGAAAGGGEGPRHPHPPAITAFLLAEWSEQGSRMSIRGYPRRRLRGSSSRRRLRSSSIDGRFWSCTWRVWSCTCRSDLLLASNLWLHVSPQPLCLPLLYRARRPTCHTLPDDVGFSKKRD